MDFFKHMYTIKSQNKIIIFILDKLINRTLYHRFYFNQKLLILISTIQSAKIKIVYII